MKTISLLSLLFPTTHAFLDDLLATKGTCDVEGATFCLSACCPTIRAACGYIENGENVQCCNPPHAVNPNAVAMFPCETDADCKGIGEWSDETSANRCIGPPGAKTCGGQTCDAGGSGGQEPHPQEPPHGPGNDDPGHMCDPTECLDWTCLRWCSCYEKFPQKMELLDSWGEFEENGCGADSIPCNCGPWNSNEEVTIETMEVMNGTFINGMYIEPHTFRDELVGQLTFRDELAIKARERRLEKDRKLIEQGRKPYEVPDFRRNLINEWKEGKFDPLPKSTEKIPEFRENLKAEWAAGKFDPQIPEKLKLIFRDELKLEFLRLRQEHLEDMRNSFNLPAFQRVMHTFRADLAEKWKHGDFDRMTHEEITHFFREKLEEQWKNGKFRLSSP